MSLAVLANHMATKGRHGDDMLVHMSRDEVAHLQKLAKAHGLTLTINPETGLPEAFSLKSLLKAIAPIALGAVLGPAGFGLTGFQSALAVGGIGALATGSLEKGLMMGLGAYGGAGLGEGLKAAAVEGAANSSTAIADPTTAANAAKGAGTGAGASAAPKFAYEAAAQMTPRPTAFDLGTGMFEANAPIAAPEMFSQPAPVIPAMTPPQPTSSLDWKSAVANEKAWADASLGDKAKMAYEGVAKDPMKFAKDNMGSGLSALYAGVALGQEEPKLPQGKRYQGYIRNYGYDPYSGVFTPGEITPASKYAANGGLMGYNNGGIVALAEGGTGDPIADLYSSIGRTGDAEGIAYWTDRLNSGESMADIANAFGASAQYVMDREASLVPSTGAAAPMSYVDSGGDSGGGGGGQPTTVEQLYQQVLGSNSQSPMTTATTTATPTADQYATITNIYQNALGRDPDPVGLNYWANRLAQGAGLEQVYAEMQGSARSVLGIGNTPTSMSMSAADAAKAYTGYKSPDNRTIADEWIRNLLGRETTDADREAGWYKAANEFKTDAQTQQAYEQFLASFGSRPSKNLPTWFEAARLQPLAPRSTAATTGAMPGWTFDPNATLGSGLVRPREDAVESTPWTPGTGKTPTTQQVVNTYTQGGGQTGRLPYVPRSLEEQEKLYNKTTGTSKAAYDYLMGRGKYPASAAFSGPVGIPYGQAVMGLPASTYNTRYIYDDATKSYIINPNYTMPTLPVPLTAEEKAKLAAPDEAPTGGNNTGYEFADGGIAQLAGYSPQEMASVNQPTEGFASAYGVRGKPKRKIGYTNSVFDQGEGSPTSAPTGPADPNSIAAAISMALGNIAELGVTALGMAANAVSPTGNPNNAPVSDVNPTPVSENDTMDNMAPPSNDTDTDTSSDSSTAPSDGDTSGDSSAGGWAHGGAIPHYARGGIYNLGGYSDGGRLLRGPGDGVSDSIPATIGDRQPARLADGEFVIPARIVSELGNGSTDAGARKLYAMMDRIQAQRKKTVGKGKVAVNSRADKLLPV